MKIFSSKKRAAAIGAVTAATLITGTVAFAYWTATGSSTAEVKAGSDAAWVVAVTGDLTTMSLAPTTAGGTPVQEVPFSVTNDGEGVQRLNTVTVSVDSVLPSTCSPSNFKIGPHLLDSTSGSVQFNPGVELTTAAPDNVYSNSVDLRLINDTLVNQNACKGAVVTLKVDAV